MAVQLHPSWLEHLQPEFDAEYMLRLRGFLQAEKKAGNTVFPPGPMIFNALNSTPLDGVKVVIIGQDPYHGPGQAHGLSFSVPSGVRPPPSLKNIFKELKSDLDIDNQRADLTPWAQQGVLLLNSVLTVRQASPASHQKQGWERFTDQVIGLINRHQDHVVFMLWGSHAQRKGQGIDHNRHLLLKAPHPSPLSAHRGFLGCRHFSQCNKFLEAHHKMPIDWHT